MEKTQEIVNKINPCSQKCLLKLSCILYRPSVLRFVSLKDRKMSPKRLKSMKDEHGTYILFSKFQRNEKVNLL